MNNPIRVAMIIQRYHPHVGGAEKQLASVIPLLKREGCEVHVLTRRFDQLPRFEKINDVPVHRLPAFGPKAVASAMFTFSALPLLQKISPDIIHAHELLSPTTTGLFAKRLFRFPVVAKVLRGGILGDITKLERRKFGYKRIDRLVRNVDTFITISSEIDSELREVGIPNDRRCFIPNGVDTIRYSPQEESKKELRQSLNLPNVPTVLFAGRLAPEKRLDQLLDIWPSIRESYPEANLILLGTGEDEERLKRMAPAEVQFLGNVKDVVPYLRAADIFALPSDTEGLSNALLEAMSCGLAVIATSVGGARDLVDHKETGWLIPPDSPGLLKAGLMELLKDSELRSSLGKYARERVIQKYSLPLVAHNLRLLYDRVLGSDMGQPVEHRPVTIPSTQLPSVELPSPRQ